MGLKVAMSGAGGDELFGGYTSFRDIPRWMPITSLLHRIPRFGDVVHSINTAMARRSRHVSPKMGEIVRYGASYAGAYFVKRGRFLTSDLDDIIGHEVAQEGLRRLDMLNLIERAITPDPGNAFARIAALESSLYLRNQILRDTDWASMAHSLEVRVPLLMPSAAPRRTGSAALWARGRFSMRRVRRLYRRNRRKAGFTLPQDG